MSDELKEKAENGGEINADEGLNILDIAAESADEAVSEDATANEPEKEEEVNVDLESPLVVHKQGDTSFLSELENSSDDDEEEDDDNGEATLTRHRFRKEKKKGGKGILFLFLVLVIVAVIAALYFTGNLSFSPQNTTTAATTEDIIDDDESTTSLQDKYKGTIVVKGTYIFVDGQEVDGIEGLQSAIEYEDKSTTAYTIIDEGANKDFFNYDVLDILTKLGFYGKDTKTEHVANTGLIAAAETTTLPPETTTKKKAAKKESSKKTTAKVEK